MVYPNAMLRAGSAKPMDPPAPSCPKAQGLPKSRRESGAWKMTPKRV